jgi:capsular polysaccharide biosynthesis protein
MTLCYLDYHLPTELSDMIYYELHKSLMREVSIILKHKIVFILVGGKLSFLICENQNYYAALDVFN